MIRILLLTAFCFASLDACMPTKRGDDVFVTPLPKPETTVLPTTEKPTTTTEEPTTTTEMPTIPSFWVGSRNYSIYLERRTVALCEFAESSGNLKVALLRHEGNKVIAQTDLAEFINDDNLLDLNRVNTKVELQIPEEKCNGHKSICDGVDAVLIQFWGANALFIEKWVIEFYNEDGSVDKTFTLNAPQIPCHGDGITQWLDGNAPQCVAYFEKSQPVYNTGYYIYTDGGVKYVLNMEDSQKYLKNELPNPMLPCRTD